LDESLSLSFRLTVLAATLLAWLGLYFLLNRRTVDPTARIDLGTALDRRIPFVPVFAVGYFSTYVYVVQPFIILSDARLFYWMLASFAAISLASSLIHAALPSMVERADPGKEGGLPGHMLGLFQTVCKPYGNFPSMHVGLTVPVVAANFMAGGPVIGGFMLAWAVMIALSTLYTKQHYVLDVLAGSAVGLVISAITLPIATG
jgi:membrane-associated phospholipid phosphatase